MLKFYYERWYFSPYMSSIKLPGCFSVWSAETAEWCCIFHPLPQVLTPFCQLYSLYCDQTLLFWDAGLKRPNSPFCYERVNLCQDPEESKSCCRQWHDNFGEYDCPGHCCLIMPVQAHVGHALTREKESTFTNKRKLNFRQLDLDVSSSAAQLVRPYSKSSKEYYR